METSRYWVTCLCPYHHHTGDFVPGSRFQPGPVPSVIGTWEVVKDLLPFLFCLLSKQTKKANKKKVVNVLVLELLWHFKILLMFSILCCIKLCMYYKSPFVMFIELLLFFFESKGSVFYFFNES